MGLCLMVYSLGQREVREQLYQAKTGIPNQLGKLKKLVSYRAIAKRGLGDRQNPRRF